MTIQTKQLDGLSVRKFYALKDSFDFNPPYQREGNVWPTETKQLFIDSIINGFLIPRVYIEQTALKEHNSVETSQRWAILDGKQRLHAIMDFADDRFTLSEEFIYLAAWDDQEHSEDDSDRFKHAGKRLSQLRNDSPEIARKFDAFIIPAVTIQTTSTDEIEEMFARLNSASNLNAAERRNAVSCTLREYTNILAKSSFFTDKCPIKDARYKYRELASKLIVAELQYAAHGKLLNLKAKTLMDAFRSSKNNEEGFREEDIIKAHSYIEKNLARMSLTFSDNDSLLRSIGSLVVYYLCFRDETISPSREKLERFEELRREQAIKDRTTQEPDDTDEARLLRIYNSWVQSSNDGRALEERSWILKAFLTHDDHVWASAIASKILVPFSEEVGSAPTQSLQLESD